MDSFFHIILLYTLSLLSLAPALNYFPFLLALSKEYLVLNGISLTSLFIYPYIKLSKCPSKKIFLDLSGISTQDDWVKPNALNRIYLTKDKNVVLGLYFVPANGLSMFKISTE